MKLEKARGILGVTGKDSPADIKKAYRRLALLHHPDKGGSKDKFQEISRAYKRVTDPTSCFGDQDSDDEGDEEGGGFDMTEEEMFGMFDDMFGDLMSTFGDKVKSGEMNEEDLMERVMLGGMQKMMNEAMGNNVDDDICNMDKEEVIRNMSEMGILDGMEGMEGMMGGMGMGMGGLMGMEGGMR